MSEQNIKRMFEAIALILSDREHAVKVAVIVEKKKDEVVA
jgi:hypothetical protein